MPLVVIDVRLSQKGLASRLFLPLCELRRGFVQETALFGCVAEPYCIPHTENIALSYTPSLDGCCVSLPAQLRSGLRIMIDHILEIHNVLSV